MIKGEPLLWACDQLAGQFLLTQYENLCPWNWPKRTIADWFLATHPSLPVGDVRGPDHQLMGWTVGQVITAEGQLNPESLQLPTPLTDEQIEKAIYQLSGRYIVVLPRHIHRLYLDAGGSLAAVFSANEPIVASTPTLVNRHHHNWDTELAELLGLPQQNRWYPSGLTSKHYVKRLLPNHYLDLSNWQTKRHWPKRPFETSRSEIHRNVRTITNRLQHTLSTIAGKAPLSLSLTAGRDSRMLLACARGVLDRASFFTFSKNKPNVDTTIAQKIARRFKLNHRNLHVENSNSAMLKRWNLLTGECAGGEISRIYSTLRHLNNRSALLPGALGEVGRGHYWHDDDTEHNQINAAELLSRARLPGHPKLLEHTEQWLDEVDGFNTLEILDLFWIEQEGGCWAAPQHYGGDRYVHYHLTPFADRKIFEAAFSLPPEFRRSKQLVSHVLERTWPELLELPFNDFTRTEKLRRNLRKLAASQVKRALPTASVKQTTP